MTPNFFQAATLKKMWVKISPYKNMGRFYRVPFKSLLRVHIKRATGSRSLQPGTLQQTADVAWMGSHYCVSFIKMRLKILIIQPHQA